MRCAALLCPLVICACAIGVQATPAPAPPQRKFESADVDRVLGNERILTNYIRCLMEEGACTQEARDLKKLLPEVLSSGCAKCSEKQRQTTQKVVRHLQNKRPADWARLTAKYDPTGEHRKQYEQTTPSPTASSIGTSLTGASGANKSTQISTAASGSTSRGRARH